MQIRLLIIKTLMKFAKLFKKFTSAVETLREIQICSTTQIVYLNKT